MAAPTEQRGSGAANDPEIASDNASVQFQQPEERKPEQNMETAPSQSAAGAVHAEEYEATHVHAVYEKIAPHFSSTRHSPWPRVAAFLQAQHPGSIGLDVGCGNGKYLDVNPTLHIFGSDRSNELVRLARTRGSASHNLKPAATDTPAAQAAAAAHQTGAIDGELRDGGVGGTEVAVADGLALPYRLGAFDFVICIAVVHHLSTKERRVEAIGELLSRLRPSAAAKQAPGANDVKGAGTSAETWRDGSDAQDSAATTGDAIAVTDVVGDKSAQEITEGRTGSDSHAQKATALVFVWALEQASSRRGWDEGSDQDTLVPWVMRTKGRPNETFQRYYHLYKEGELEEDIVAAGGVIEESGYERDNWWAVFSRPLS